MSFSDLLSSGKGPGVIGMLMALLVLAGFGLLFMFAFDDGAQGGAPTLASTIRANEKNIVSQKARIEHGEAQLATVPELKKTSDQVRTASATNKAHESRIAEHKAGIAAANESIRKLREEFESYKNQYRAFARSNGENSNLDELPTKSGVVYKNVNVRKITAVGIEIRHSDGHKRIPYEELPDEMQDHYQFDKDQKLAEVERESSERQQHNAAVAVANEAAEVMLAERRVKEKEAERQKRILELAAKQARVQAINREIQQLESEIARADSQAAAARAAGRMHLSKANTFRSQINQKRAELANVQNDIARLKSQI